MASFDDIDPDLLAQLASQVDSSSPDPSQPITMQQRNPGSYDVASANAGTASDAAPNPSAPPMPAAPDDYTSRIVGRESGGDLTAKNPMSTASGRYQFLDGTFEGLLKTHPELAAIPGINKNDPRVMAAFTADNAKELQAGLGRDPSKTDLSAAHFFGAQGAIKFLSQDPSTPINQVFGPSVLNANKSVLLNKDGSPKTVGEVYAQGAKLFGEDTSMPSIGSGGATMAQRNPGAYALAAGNSGTATDANPNPSAPPSGASDSQVMPLRMGGYQTAQSAYAPAQSALAEYMKNQPAMWQKLQEMQDQYAKQTQPSMLDKVGDALNNYSQASMSAKANQLASMGGVMMHALPSSADFNRSLENAHQSDLQQRQASNQRALAMYNMGSGNVLAQNQQAGQNLALQNSLTGDMAKYGFETQKATNDLSLSNFTKQLELAKFGQSQQQDILKTVTESVKDPNSLPGALDAVTKVLDPTKSYQANMSAAQQALQAYQQQPGVRFSGDQPNMQTATWTDPQTGETQRRRADLTTPEGRREAQTWPQTADVHPVNPTGTSVNTTNNVGGGGTEGSGGGTRGQAAPMQQLATASNTASVAKGVLALAPYIGQTGPIQSKAMDSGTAQMIKNITGLDPFTTAPRQLFQKLVSQLGNQETTSLMGSAGERGGAMLTGILNKGVISSDADIEAIKSYAQHAANLADWESGRLHNQIQQQRDAFVKGDTRFQPHWSDYQYEYGDNGADAHPRPVWNEADTLGAITPPKTQTTSSNPANRTNNQGGPQLGEVRALPGTNRQFRWNGTTWEPAQ
jgi:hypothetical protein